MKKRRVSSTVVGAIITAVAIIIAAVITAVIQNLPEKTPPVQQKIEKSPVPFQAEKDINKKTEPNKAPTTSPEAIPPKVTTIKPREKGEKEERLNEFKTLINAFITTHFSKPNIALVIESKKTESGVSPENALYNLLRTEKINIIINLFKEEPFKAEGFFNEIYNGNTELLRHADALSKIDNLILGRLSYSFQKGVGIDRDLVSCNIKFSYNYTFALFDF